MSVKHTHNRPFVLSIAGFDPSAGAGLLADIKTFENCNVYGLGVVSALTVQNDIEFNKVNWLSFTDIKEQIEVLLKRFSFEYIKIGLIQDLDVLYELILFIKKNNNNNPKIIWDPILKASAGFDFHTSVNQTKLENICKNIYLITPNITEAFQLGTHNHAKDNALYLSTFCNVYLKGGHDEQNTGRDILFLKDKIQIVYENTSDNLSEKHGSGCVLSSAITAFLAKGYGLEETCKHAKEYIIHFLSSNKTLLGYHKTELAIE
jgi:hydroxymethylpyrimidine/phosphomethylpyrimidine kinase